MSTAAPVAVCTVTHNAEHELAGYLAAVAALQPAPQEVVVADCRSEDRSLELVRAAERGQTLPLRSIALEENRGFAGGTNAAIAATTAPWLLFLNPDARPEADYLGALLAGAARAQPPLPRPGDRVGAVTGRLTRLVDEGRAPGPPLLDACGMVLTRSWRHLDRGGDQADRGQFAHPAWVFGATGAASLFGRAALEDTAIDGEYLLNEFHTFREDAELCFRLQERGWGVLYEPRARCAHRRSVTPARRRALAPAWNRHSLRNRFLLRAYHQTAGNVLPTLLPALARDLAALLYVLTRERSSLPALAELWRNRRAIRRRRRTIQQRRLVEPAVVERWFAIDQVPLRMPR